MSKQITALVASGADGFSNLYDVAIQFPWNEEDLTVTVRAKGFSIPDTGVGTYEKTYHGIKITAVKPEHDFTRTFEIEFRLDASYNLYGQFVTWLSTVGDMVSGGVSNWAPMFGRVHVNALGGSYSATNEPSLTEAGTDAIKSESTNAQWDFQNVIVTKVTQPKFTTDTSDPLTYTVTFFFGETNMPFFNSTGITGK